MLELSIKAGTGTVAFIIEWVTSSKLDAFRKLATASLNTYVLPASNSAPGIVTRLESDRSPLVTFVISVTSSPLPGDIKDHTNLRERPPPPKDWDPERVRFPQEESVSGPVKKIYYQRQYLLAKTKHKWFNFIIYSPQDIAIFDNLIDSLFEAYGAMYH